MNSQLELFALQIESLNLFSFEKSKKLALSLRNLDALIGIDDVKTSVCNHLKLLLVTKQTGEVFTPPHALIVGVPGVGKTELAQKLAEIWALVLWDCNLLNGGGSPNLENAAIYDESCDDNFLVSDLSILVQSLRKKYAPRPVSMNSVAAWGGGNDDEWDLIERVCDKIMLNQSSRTTNNHHFPQILTNGCGMTNKPILSHPYIIAGRETFIGMYQGHTTDKTSKFLAENKGKVVIIEEAYTLCTSPTDTFGLELLTQINRHMTEKPNDNSFIFCGYSDLINEKLFSVQPGLRRRFQTVFTLSGYSPFDLFQIFIKQLTDAGGGWKVSCEETCEQFFEGNFSKFPAFGGDTIRFLTGCKMSASTRVLSGFPLEICEDDMICALQNLVRAS